MARALRGAGLGPGAVAAVTADSTESVALLTFAAPLAGCALMPLDPALDARDRDRLIISAGARLIPDSVLNAPDSAIPEMLFGVPEDIHVIATTSGTTEGPKGVMLRGSTIAASVRASRARLGLDPADCWLCTLPLFHVGGLSILYRVAEAGASARLRCGFEASEVWADLSGDRVTHVSLVPAMLARVLDVADGPPPPMLRRVLVGGGSLSAEVGERARAAGWSLSPTYGLTEAASQVATLDDLPDDWVPGLVGKPLDGFEVAIAEDGRIRIRGTAMMAGYMAPGLMPGIGLELGGWFTTGDLGRIDAQGRLAVLGRADEVLVTGGETVNPVEVEARLMACPGVHEAALTAVPDPVWGDRLVALVVGDTDAGAVEDWCRANIAGARRPRRVRMVPGLPRTPLGKLVRSTLRTIAAQ